MKIGDIYLKGALYTVMALRGLSKKDAPRHTKSHGEIEKSELRSNWTRHGGDRSYFSIYQNRREEVFHQCRLTLEKNKRHDLLRLLTLLRPLGLFSKPPKSSEIDSSMYVMY